MAYKEIAQNFSLSLSSFDLEEAAHFNAFLFFLDVNQSTTWRPSDIQDYGKVANVPVVAKNQQSYVSLDLFMAKALFLSLTDLRQTLFQFPLFARRSRTSWGSRASHVCRGSCAGSTFSTAHKFQCPCPCILQLLQMEKKIEFGFFKCFHTYPPCKKSSLTGRDGAHGDHGDCHEEDEDCHAHLVV